MRTDAAFAGGEKHSRNARRKEQRQHGHVTQLFTIFSNRMLRLASAVYTQRTGVARGWRAGRASCALSAFCWCSSLLGHTPAHALASDPLRLSELRKRGPEKELEASASQGVCFVPWLYCAEHRHESPDSLDVNTHVTLRSSTAFRLHHSSVQSIHHRLIGAQGSQTSRPCIACGNWPFRWTAECKAECIPSGPHGCLGNQPVFLAPSFDS